MHIRFRWAYIQCMAVLLITMLLWMIVDTAIAGSVLLGSLVHIIPNIIFISCVFKKLSDPNPSLILRWFYFGEVCKIFLTAVLFALCFIWAQALSVNIAILLFSYVMLLCINLLGVFLLEKNSNNAHTQSIAGT